MPKHHAVGSADHVVARIGKPHGLRGEVTVRLHTDDAAGRFQPGAAFTTEAVPGSGVPRVLTVRSARDHNGIWLLAFDGIPDRTGAESLRGAHLLVGVPSAGRASGAAAEPGSAPAEPAPAAGRAEAAPAPTEGESADDGWYADDLVGLAVDALDGTRVGRVEALEYSPAHELLVVALHAGGRAYVPFVEAIVPVVDISGGRLVIDPPGGLLELNR